VAERLRGHVRWFSRQKLYGRIQCGHGLPDIFAQVGDPHGVEGVHELDEGVWNSALGKRQRDP
jgi:cold shock CspA family protein